MEYLTEEEIEAHPDIKRLRVGSEPVPRGVLFVARRLPIDEDDIAWAREVARVDE